jgi:hypothetical protein
MKIKIEINPTIDRVTYKVGYIKDGVSYLPNFFAESITATIISVEELVFIEKNVVSSDNKPSTFSDKGRTVVRTDNNPKKLSFVEVEAKKMKITTDIDANLYEVSNNSYSRFHVTEENGLICIIL